MKGLVRWVNIYSVVCVVYMGVLFVLSSSPTEIEVESFSAFDKLVHVGAYGVLAVLIYLVLQRVGESRYVFGFAFLGSFVYGIVNEVRQAFLPWRDADIADVAANGIGALCFLLVLSLTRRSRSNKRSDRII